jgi:hypothetical protein
MLSPWLRLLTLLFLIDEARAGQFTRVDKDIVDVVKHCKKLSLQEFHQFVDELGSKKQFNLLTQIYNAQLPCGWYAATVYARELDEDKVIGFCTQFDLDSDNWSAATWALSSHRKMAVIGYIKQIATSAKPYARAQCYMVCRNAGWDDLVEMAKSDVSNSYPLVGPGYAVGATLGTVAKQYINSFAHHE